MNKKDLAIFALIVGSMFGLIGYTTYGHVDEQGTRQAAEDFGLTNVEIKGGAHLQCRSFYKTTFTAVTAKGEKVEAIACGAPKMTTGITSVRINKKLD